MQDPPSILAETTEGNLHAQQKRRGSACLGSAEPLRSSQLMAEWRNGLYRNQQQQQSQMLLLSWELPRTGHSSKHLNCKRVIASHRCLAPKAEGWQVWGSWMLFSRKCPPELGRSVERLQRLRLKHYSSGSPVAKAVLALAGCIESEPLHLLSQLRPRGLRQRSRMETEELLWVHAVGWDVDVRLSEEHAEEACSLT